MGMVRRFARLVGLILLFFVITASASMNFFGVAQWDMWANWQLDSESLVLNRVEADALAKDVPSTGLLLGLPLGQEEVHSRIADPGFPNTDASRQAMYELYTSNLGLIANTSSALWNFGGCSLTCQRGLNSALYAGVCIALFMGLAKAISRGFGWAWLIAVVCSPWLTMAARNLFWAPWLWLLPAAMTTLLVFARTRTQRWAAVSGIFVAFVLKYALTGYELFTSITILAASIPLLSIAFRSQFAVPRARQLWNALYVVVASGVAFASVMAFHAYLLAGSIPSGFAYIWRNTILRRTYADPSGQDPMYQQALNASPLRVLNRYISPEWWFQSDFLSFGFNEHGSVFSVSLGGTAFAITLAACCLAIVVRWSRSDPRWRRDAALILLGFAVAASWFVAAKAHSYLHNHILFVLWYLLLVPSMVFVLTSVVWDYRAPLSRIIDWWYPRASGSGAIREANESAAVRSESERGP